MPSSMVSQSSRSRSRAAKGASDVAVAEGVAKKLEELRRAYPNVEIKQIDSTVEYTLGVYQATIKTLLEGAVLAILVVFVFLRDLRATSSRPSPCRCRCSRPSSPWRRSAFRSTW